MRVRVRYRKQGRLRFVGAIDIGRVWERALRRADLPIAYSEGFSPHPKVSFTDALPLGLASDGEYAELTFAAPVDLARDVRLLNTAFPEGIDVTAAVDTPDGAPRFAKLLQASAWDLEYSQDAALEKATVLAMDADQLVVPRERKGESVDIDIRPAIVSLSTDGVRVRAVTHHADHLPPQTSVAVRPTEVDLALRRFVPDLPQPVLVLRLAQGRPEADGLVEALTGERIEPLRILDQRHVP